jgi:hypothetical protein
MTIAGDLDFLKGLADRRGEILVAGLPGLRAPARANLVRLRRRVTELMGELTLEVATGTELAVILGTIQARDHHPLNLTIHAHDTRVELWNLVIAGIDGPSAGGTISANLHFSSPPSRAG